MVLLQHDVWHYSMDGSPWAIALTTRELYSPPEPFTTLPPEPDRRLVYTNLRQHTDWSPLYQDTTSKIYVYNRVTGCVREGAWISIRAGMGEVFFFNLITRVCTWFPPIAWHSAWFTRRSPESTTTVTGAMVGRDRDLELVKLAHQRVEGGAPYMYESFQGVPPYDATTEDTVFTHPALLELVH